MPNYQTTNIRVSGKKEVIDELLKSVVATEEYLAKIEQRNADIPDDFKIKPAELGCVDFNILIPKPDNIYTAGSVGKEEEKKYGSNNWYTWNCGNWGTKWNACYDKVVRIDDENLEISFDTAWNCPFPWFEKFIEKAKELGVEKLEGESLYEEYCNYGFDWDDAVETSDDDEDFNPDVFGFKLQRSDDELYLQWFRPARLCHVKTLIFKDEAEFDEYECEYYVNGCTQEFLDEHNIKLEEYDEIMYEKANKGCFNCWNCEHCKECNNCNNCKFCQECDNCLDCNNCSSCYNCLACNECWICDDCNDCIGCGRCERCIKCENCIACWDCKECKDCKDCKNCNDAANEEGLKKDDDEE